MSHNPQEALRAAVEDLLETQFATEYGSSLPIKHDGVKFTQTPNEFLADYFHYMPRANRSAIGTGSPFDRYQGFYCVECHIKEDTGTKKAWEMAGAVTRIFNGRQFSIGDGSFVSFMTPNTPGHPDRRNGFLIVTVMCPFWMDACNL